MLAKIFVAAALLIGAFLVFVLAVEYNNCQQLHSDLLRLQAEVGKPRQPSYLSGRDFEVRVQSPETSLAVVQASMAGNLFCRK